MKNEAANMLTVLTLLAIGGVCCRSAFSETTEIPHLQHEPRTDGVLDAAEWAGAAHFTEFRETSEKRQSDIVPPGLRTEAWVARTAGGLCAAFRCRHDQMGQMVTAVKTSDPVRHDGPVWADDSVEVFLDAHGTRYDYYHFIANAAGALYDAFNKEPSRGDGTWDSGAIAAGRLLPDGYSVEMNIPWTSLNLGLNGKGIVGLNLCRNVRYTVGRQSLFGEYHRPATWREFRLDRAGPKWFPVAAEQIEWSDLSGANELVARFRNLTATPLRLSGRFAVAQGKQRQEEKFDLNMDAEKTAEARLPYTVSDESGADFRLALQNSNGEIVLTSQRSLQPRPIAAVSVDTDVLLRGEKPLVTVSLAVPRASARDYAVRFDVRTPDGTPVLQRSVPPSARTSLEEALDLAAAPTAAQRLVVETTITNTRSQGIVFQGKTPLYIIGSPWSE